MQLVQFWTSSQPDTKTGKPFAKIQTGQFLLTPRWNQVRQLGLMQIRVWSLCVSVRAGNLSWQTGKLLRIWVQTFIQAQVWDRAWMWLLCRLQHLKINSDLFMCRLNIAVIFSQDYIMWVKLSVNFFSCSTYDLGSKQLFDGFRAKKKELCKCYEWDVKGGVSRGAHSRGSVAEPAVR